VAYPHRSLFRLALSEGTPLHREMSCQDLVVFNYARVEDALKLDMRTFSFFQQDLSIKQKWQEGGKGGSSIGFGCSVYDCSFVLAKYMEDHMAEICGKHCVELGCGPALTSIACAFAQPASIVATDGDDISVELARENIRRNLCPSSSATATATAAVDNSAGAGAGGGAGEHTAPSPCVCTAERLLWGDAADLQNFPANTYDVVLAADVVAVPYEGAYLALLNTMQHLLRPGGCLWLCYQQRHASEKEGFFDLFHEMFDVEQIETQQLHRDFRNTLVPIHIFKARHRKHPEEGARG